MARRAGSVLLLLAVLFLALEGAGLVMVWAFSSRPIVLAAAPEGAAGGKALPGDLPARNRALLAKLEALSPHGVHVVVDTGANRLTLMDGTKVLRTAVVSCGSGNILPNPLGGKDWVFDTPRGEFKVETRIKNPFWVRPDWAFIEEGEKIPKKFDERIEEGVMGDYALGIGHGYFLHGTLYTRLLGRNVTHGCVRIGDEDLKALYQTVPIGARVYIY